MSSVKAAIGSGAEDGEQGLCWAPILADFSHLMLTDNLGVEHFTRKSGGLEGGSLPAQSYKIGKSQGLDRMEPLTHVFSLSLSGLLG